MTRLTISPTRKRVFLADSQPLVREWLARTLCSEPGVMVCGEAANVRSAKRGIAASDPHVVVMDLIFPDGSGLDMVEEIARRRPPVFILALSTYDEVYYARRVLRLGAIGYVSKQEPTRKIMSALRHVLKGEAYLSAACTQSYMTRDVRHFGSGDAPSVQSLSDRELEVFAMVGRGLGTRQIAAMLRLSAKTVEVYRGRIKTKLRLRCANELLREAIAWTDKTASFQVRSPRARAGPLMGVIGLSAEHLGWPAPRG